MKIFQHNLSSRIGFGLSFMHLSIFLYFFYIVVKNSETAQMQLLFTLFFMADFPVSLLHVLKIGFISHFFAQNGYRALAYVFYPPLIVDGVLGTVWWYFLPIFFLPKKFGGLW